MNFLHHPEKLPEKIEHAELVAYGYRWGKKDGLAMIARQLRASIVAQESIIKGLLELSIPYFNDTHKGDR